MRPTPKMKIRIILSSLFFILLSACSTISLSNAGNSNARPALAQLQPGNTTGTPVPVSIPTRVPTFTAVPTVLVPLPVKPVNAQPAIQMIRQGPDQVICPILLYHRIAIPQIEDPYYVTPDQFRAQMQALKDWGYTTISISRLVDVIHFGGKLPARPIIISFDDGDITVYTQAYPVMREFGFKAVNYLVADYVNTPGYMNTDQLKELAAAGWDTGSHSLTHPDLTTSKQLDWEVEFSRQKLEKLLDVTVDTFAYPYGKTNDDIKGLVVKHYTAAMGLGVYTTQKRSNLYFLWRRPVELGCDVKTLASYLPWNTPPEP
jgi:peptidoglycan/xylan/chitin deacetylase (PgdA/CDA1 family)